MGRVFRHPQTDASHRYSPSACSEILKKNALDRNLILANYNSEEEVDTDDGSSYYDIHDNVIYQGKPP